MKNNNTKKTGRKQLAKLLSKVMKHPLTPDPIIRELGNALCDMSTEIDHDSPKLIEMSLTAFETKNAQRRKK